MENNAVRRPKLKQDSLFLETRDGVFLRSDDAAFILKGKSVYRWLSALSPYMTGEYTLEEICKNLEPAQQDMIARLVETLMQRGVLKQHIPEPIDLLPEPVLRHFRAQIELIDHYVEQPVARFKTFRESQVVLVGSGEALEALALALLRNGMREVTLSMNDSADMVTQAIKDEIDALSKNGVEARCSVVQGELRDVVHEQCVVVYCADAGSFGTVLALQKLCLSKKCRFLSAVVIGNQAVLGPLVEPEGGPCWLCAQMRLAANMGGAQAVAVWRALALGDEANGRASMPFAATARRIGTHLGFELFKMLTAHLPSELSGGIVIYDLETLESYHGKLVRHPLCPTCSRSSYESALQQLQKIVQGGYDKKLELGKETQQLFNVLVDKYTGVLQTFMDDTLTQLPLKVSRLKVASPTSPLAGELTVTAFSSETLLDARFHALLEAIGCYARRLFDGRALTRGSMREMAERGLQVVAPPRLGTCCGVASFDPNSRCDWLPAYALLADRFCYVPAAAVYADTYSTSAHLFESTSAGAAVHANFQGLLADGIVSALAYERVRDAVRGRAAVIRLEQSALEELDPNLAFLLRCTTHFERSFEVLEIAGAAPLHVMLARTTDSQAEQIVTVGYGYVALEAATKALLPLVGNLQLLKYEEGFVVPPHPFFPDLPAHTPLRYSTTATSRVQEPATSVETLLDHVQSEGRDVLFVNTTPADLLEAGAFLSGTLLLSQAFS